MAKDVDAGRPVRAVTVHSTGAQLAPDGRPIHLVTEVAPGTEKASDGRMVLAVGEGASVYAADGQQALAVEYVAAGILGSHGRPIQPVSRYDVSTGARAGQSIILLILTGQSNMNGRTVNDGLNVERSNTFQYDCWDASPTWKQLLASTLVLQHPENLDRTGPDDQILDRYAVANPDSLVVAVPMCVGGQGFMAGGTFEGGATAGTSGSNFNKLVDRSVEAVAALQAAYPGCSITPIMHVQNGEAESQASESRAGVADYLGRFVDYARSRMAAGSGLAAFSTMHVVIGLTPTQYWFPTYVGTTDPWRTVVAGMVDTYLARSNCFIVSGGVPSLGPDYLHWNPASQARLQGDAQYEARFRTDVPAITTNTVQSNELATTLAVEMTYTGDQTDATDLCTWHIVGGAHASEFELDNAYVSATTRPRLRWSGADTGPSSEGFYEVQVALRNAAGVQGASTTITVEVAEPDIVPVNFRSTYYSPASFNTAYGTTGFTVAGVPVKAGENLFYFQGGTGANMNDYNFVMRVDGNPITKVAATTTGTTIQVWRYTHVGADTTVSVNGTWNNAASNGCLLIAGVVEGVDPTPTATDVVPWQNTNLGSTTMSTASLTCPSGGIIVGLGILGNSMSTPVAPCVEVDQQTTSTVYPTWMERESTGPISWVQGHAGHYRAMVAVAFNPA